MRILHCCLSNFYIDNYSYQENILPKMHKLQGHHVKIVASTESFDQSLKYTYLNPATYINEHGIEVTRLPYKNFGFSFITRKLQVYKGLTSQLYEFKPDIIFLHGVSFGSTREIINYKKNNPQTLLFADNHADLFNSATNWLSRYVLHRIYYRHHALALEPYLEKIFGVLPIRKNFLIEEYGFNPDKVELLNMGFDDSLVDLTNKGMIRRSIREKLGIRVEDFVLITGGKLDKKKKMELVVGAFNQLRSPRLHLIVFGKPINEYQETFDQLINNSINIHLVGWLNNEETILHILAADLAIFPGGHSVLWEMSVGLGVPSLFKEWDNMHHLKLSNKIDFLKEENADEIAKWIIKLMNHPDYYKELKRDIEAKGDQFKYSEIAKQAIQPNLF